MLGECCHYTQAPQTPLPYLITGWSGGAGIQTNRLGVFEVGLN